MSVSTPIVGLLSYVQNLQNSGENETRQDYKYWRRTTVTKYEWSQEGYRNKTAVNKRWKNVIRKGWME